MGEAKKIGKACQSGNITDCNEGIPVNETVPANCQGVLIFSETANYPHTCGKYCEDLNKDNNKTSRILSPSCENNEKKCGWTKFMRFDQRLMCIFFQQWFDQRLMFFQH